jgi:hypothetical protein
MANLDDRSYPQREVAPGRNVYPSPANNYPNQATSVSEGVTRRDHPLPGNVAYRDGYTQGRLSQQRIDATNQAIRDNDSAGRGLLLGILVTALAAFAVGMVFLLNQRNQNPVPTIIQRITPNASPSPTQSPQVRERIIERDRVVPVPQNEPPQVNITVPEAVRPVSPPPGIPGSPETQTGPQTGITNDPAQVSSPGITPDETGTAP